MMYGLSVFVVLSILGSRGLLRILPSSHRCVFFPLKVLHVVSVSIILNTIQIVN